jgi:hypothetical protein
LSPSDRHGIGVEQFARRHTKRLRERDQVVDVDAAFAFLDLADTGRQERPAGGGHPFTHFPEGQPLLGP